MGSSMLILSLNRHPTQQLLHYFVDIGLKRSPAVDMLGDGGHRDQGILARERAAEIGRS